MREKKVINIQIGERIRMARDRAGLTQEQLAEQIEVSAQFVSDLERGVVGISIPTLKRVCMVLHISSDEILFQRSGGFCMDPLFEKCRSLNEAQQAHLTAIIEHYLSAINEY